MSDALFTQGATTMEKPFQLFPTGIFLRNLDGWGLFFTRKSTDLETMFAILECLNRAWREGFSEGVQTGLQMSATQS